MRVFPTSFFQNWGWWAFNNIVKHPKWSHKMMACRYPKRQPPGPQSDHGHHLERQRHHRGHPTRLQGGDGLNSDRTTKNTLFPAEKITKKNVRNKNNEEEKANKQKQKTLNQVYIDPKDETSNPTKTITGLTRLVCLRMWRIVPCGCHWDGSAYILARWGCLFQWRCHHFRFSVVACFGWFLIFERSWVL